MKKYQIIYADPPWKYFQGVGTKRYVGNHYSVMSVEDLCALPVTSISENDCALFLWTTPPCLREAMQVLTAWGFEYKTKAFCWVKTNTRAMSLFTGMGYWTRSNTEDCWLATRGHPKRLNADVRQVIMSDVMGHSHKPAIAREKIVRLMGDIPRIELFARRKIGGWDCIGYDIDGVDINEALNRIAQE